MDWNSPYKAIKEVEDKSLMGMRETSSMDVTEYGVGSSDKEGSSQMKQRKKSMSVYLKFFETATDGKIRKCKFCKQAYSTSTATGNLRRHLDHHHPGYEQQGNAVPQIVHPEKKIAQSETKSMKVIDFEHLNLILIRWLITTSLPLSTIEDKTLLSAFRYLMPTVEIWPIEKVQLTTSKVYRSMRDDVAASLQNIGSKISISLEFWTSSEQIFYMSVSGFWIDGNWTLRKVLLDVCRISYPHGVNEIINAFWGVLKEFKISKCILACTLDASQPSVNAFIALKEVHDAGNMAFGYIPCAAQALNMIIEDGMKPIRPTLMKIREAVREMNSSPLIGEDFQQLTSVYNEGTWQLPIDTSTCWNGDYAMLDCAKKAPTSMEILTRKHERSIGGKGQLLTPDEKSTVNFLHSHFEPFYKITTNLSSDKVPTVGLVLFLMDHAFETISAFKENYAHEYLKSCAADMAEKARKFNAAVKGSLAFTAALLDPRIKKDLMPESLNSEELLEETRSLFSKNYSRMSNFPSLVNGPTLQDDESNGVSFAEEIARKRRRMCVVGKDELAQYLSEPTVPIATNVLDWWKVNSMRYPQLSLMARDYLAIQGTSVESGNLFSGKGVELQRRRFCLPHDSIHDVLCIQSWVESGYKFRF